MAAEYELPGGSHVILYTADDIDVIVNASNAAARRVEAFSTGPCRSELESLVSTIDQAIREMAANSIATRRVARWGLDVPEEYVGGSWLTQIDATSLRSAFDDFSLEALECEDLEGIDRFISDPDEPADAAPPVDDVLSVGTASAGGGSALLGLGLAASVVGVVWLIFKGKKR